jgi:hypothetical protein
LARLHSPTDEAPGYGWFVQTVPWEQLHEVPHLPDVLQFIILADSLLWDVANVTKGGGVGLFSDVEPFLVPITKGGILGAAEVLRLHSIMKCQVHSFGDLRSPLDPFFRRQNR